MISIFDQESRDVFLVAKTERNVPAMKPSNFGMVDLFFGQLQSMSRTKSSFASPHIWSAQRCIAQEMDLANLALFWVVVVDSVSFEKC